MNYDCHLEVCSLTSQERVEHHLRRWKPSGVVFVQKGTDRRSRTEWMSRLNLNHGACGVALIDGYDLHHGLDELAARGTCGALLRSLGTETRARNQDEVLRLHEVLPKTWHIELEMPWALAAKLAPFLARMDRTFCLAPQVTQAGVNEQSVGQILWWFDMGNIFLKLTSVQVEDGSQVLNRLVCRHTPDRVVLGSGPPQAEDECWWSDTDFISPEQADNNAQRLYPFFRSTVLQ